MVHIEGGVGDATSELCGPGIPISPDLCDKFISSDSKSNHDNDNNYRSILFQGEVTQSGTGPANNISYSNELLGLSPLPDQHRYFDGATSQGDNSSLDLTCLPIEHRIGEVGRLGSKCLRPASPQHRPVVNDVDDEIAKLLNDIRASDEGTEAYLPLDIPHDMITMDLQAVSECAPVASQDGSSPNYDERHCKTADDAVSNHLQHYFRTLPPPLDRYAMQMLANRTTVFETPFDHEIQSVAAADFRDETDASKNDELSTMTECSPAHHLGDSDQITPGKLANEGLTAERGVTPTLRERMTNENGIMAERGVTPTLRKRMEEARDNMTSEILVIDNVDSEEIYDDGTHVEISNDEQVQSPTYPLRPPRGRDFESEPIMNSILAETDIIDRTTGVDDTISLCQVNDHQSLDTPLKSQDVRLDREYTSPNSAKMTPIEVKLYYPQRGKSHNTVDKPLIQQIEGTPNNHSPDLTVPTLIDLPAVTTTPHQQQEVTHLLEESEDSAISQLKEKPLLPLHPHPPIKNPEDTAISPSLGRERPYLFGSVASMVDVKLDSTTLAVLIDTGAAVSVVSAKLCKDFEALRDQDYGSTPVDEAIAVNGEAIKLYGKIKVPLQFADRIVVQDMYVIDEPISQGIILGMDFLKTHNCKIDFLNDELTLDDYPPLPFIGQFNLLRSVKVYSIQPTQIPKNSQTFVRCKIAPHIQDGTQGLVEPRGDLPHHHLLYASKAMVTVRDGHVPMCVLNALNHEVHLPKYITLGHFTALTDQELNSVTLVSDPNELVGDEDDLPETPEPTPRAVDGVDLSECNVTEDQRKSLKELLNRHASLFVSAVEDLGTCNVAELDIDVQGHPPIRQRPYRVAPHQRQVIKEEIDKMLDKKIVEKSSSPWSSPIVLVKKPNGSWRFCVDYRRLNSVTRKNSFPLPNLEDSLAFGLGFNNPVIFSCMDLASGFWQIPLSSDAKAKTCFCSPDGLYQFRKMPFGLCNAPGHFQHIMTVVLGGLLWTTSLIYIDDIIVHSPSFEDHIKHLDEVFIRLRKADLRLQPGKCHFAKNQVKYLGHIVGAEGIKADPGKCEVISKFPTPRRVKDIRSFLGAAGFYRRFVKGYARIAAPLNKLLQKDEPFLWTPECQAAIDHLKKCLTSEPVMLSYPRDDLPFVLYTDACDVSIGSSLCQEVDGIMRIISYGGRALSKREKNYSTTEKECLGLVNAVHKHRVYLSHKPFTAVTDHSALVWLMKNKDNNPKLLRWSIALQAYDIHIKHQSGRLIPFTDAISRFPYDEMSLASLTVPGVDTEAIKTHQREDEDLNDIIIYLEKGELPSDSARARKVQRTSDSYFLDNSDILQYILLEEEDTTGKPYLREKLVVPKSLRDELLLWAHDSVVSGHFGRDKTLGKLKAKYYWPGLRADTEAWIKTCLACQSRKSPSKAPKAPLHPIESSEPFERIIMDIKGPLKVTPRGSKYILVLTDHFTKYVLCFPLKTQTAQEIADILFNEVICKFGSFRVLHTDKAANFVGELISKVCLLCNISKVNSTAYHPQSQGNTERMNRTLSSSLAMYINETQTDWDLYLQGCTFGYNSSPCLQSNGYPPFYLLFGRLPLLPVDTALILPPTKSRSTREYLEIILKNLQAAQEIASRNLAEARGKMKERYDRTAVPKSYDVGELCWVYTPRMKDATLKRTFGKFWTGPYIIVERISAENYKVRTMDNRKVPMVIHINRLKPYYCQERQELPVPDKEVDDMEPIPDDFIPSYCTSHCKPPSPT
jgi:hypothetical protein